MANYVSPVNQIYFSNECFTNCQNITSINLHNIPWTDNSMRGAFDQCKNLTSVSGINPNVTNMAVAFQSTLISEAPIIPNSVINMSGTFTLTRLTNAPKIPNSVTNMAFTFNYDSYMSNVPDINVPNCICFAYTFGGCSNLTKSNISSQSVTNALSMYYRCENLTDVNISIPNCTII